VIMLTNIQPIMDVLRSGREMGVPPISPREWLTLRYADGRQVEIGTFPGESEGEYAFDVSVHYYTIKRAAFVAALEAGGVERTRIPKN